HCENAAKKGKKFKVKVKVGDEYQHPDDPDHYIAWVQLWDGERMLTQASFIEGALGNQPEQLEVDFYIVPSKKMKLTAWAYCTKHGLWESEEAVEVAD
ncbi:desulfoferrodoxin family protein, partial [Bacteroidota bacterium]